MTQNGPGAGPAPDSNSGDASAVMHGTWHAVSRVRVLVCLSPAASVYAIGPAPETLRTGLALFVLIGSLWMTQALHRSVEPDAQGKRTARRLQRRTSAIDMTFTPAELRTNVTSN